MKKHKCRSFVQSEKEREMPVLFVNFTGLASLLHLFTNESVVLFTKEPFPKSFSSFLASFSHEEATNVRMYSGEPNFNYNLPTSYKVSWWKDYWSSASVIQFAEWVINLQKQFSAPKVKVNTLLSYSLTFSHTKPEVKLKSFSSDHRVFKIIPRRRQNHSLSPLLFQIISSFNFGLNKDHLC